MKRDPKQGVEANLTVYWELFEGFPIQTDFSASHEDKFTFLLVHFFFQEPIHILLLSLRLKILALSLTSVVGDKTIYEIMWDLEGSHIMS